MTMPIPNLVRRTGYMCLNNNCFYCETYLGFDDVVFKSAWSSDLEDVIPLPHCPSCDENMITEDIDDGETIQTFV